MLERYFAEDLARIYGPMTAERVLPRLAVLVESAGGKAPAPAARHAVSEADAVLIAYPDHLRDDRRPHLEVLAEFLEDRLAGLVNTVHLLPFFPYSSDDGFAVIDYREVAAELGGWQAVRRVGSGFRLMLDAVLNHVSARSRWFREYLAGNPEFADYFIECDPAADLSAVTRPRPYSLLTRFAGATGEKYLWTTFSEDQIDLNYAHPEVLLAMVDLLLFYVSRGARLIRLDAIAYLWKQPGTSCIHLPQTHAVVRLLRTVLDCVAPEVMLVTETNVPHAENVGYFGNGRNEAQAVYQFPLPPLVAHALLRGSGRFLRQWAAELHVPESECTFLNFTASHDGIGIRPLAGIVPADEQDFLVACARDRGGYVSLKTNPDGSRSPYEININYFSLLSAPGEDWRLSAARFLASQAVMLAMPGVPAVYLHSILGSLNHAEGVRQTGAYRAVNREKLRLAELARELEGNPRRHVFDAYAQMLRVRRRESAFHPHGPAVILDTEDRVFGIQRTDPAGESMIVALHNLTGTARETTFALENGPGGRLTDLLGGRSARRNARFGATFSIALDPYECVWLKGAP